ncbi:MAG: MFS transporter [Acidimicrobiales bacterium]
MQIPVRLVVLLRPSVSPGILLAVGFSTFVLSATPFLFDLLVDEYHIGLTAASLIGVFQLGGFVLGSWWAGRWLLPRRRFFVVALAVAVATNLASATLPAFAVLVALRFVSGLSLGLISWYAWVQVFGNDRGTGDIAVIGPVAGVVASPLIALFAAGGGAAGVYALLGTLAIVPLVFNRGSGASERVPFRTERSSPVPAARIILAALGLFTLGGSAVFQYAVVVGSDRLDLGAGTVALVFSANAIAAVPAAKWPWRRGLPGPWMAVTGLCAVVMPSSPSTAVFAGAITVWGFAFWMGLPGVFTVLAERSANPADRAGDAQAVMAAGRVFGPFVGGLALDLAGPGTLGLVGGSMMMLAGAAVFVVRTIAAPRVVQGPGLA